jgi:acyl-CoA synthetase (NDP forming)
MTFSTEEAAAIDAVFRPRRIAVFGASSDPKKFGSQVLRNLQTSGFTGELSPISRSSTEINGVKAHPSLRDLPEAVDLVLLSLPVQHVAAAVEDAAATSAKAAVIFTAGFQEVGAEGRALQDEVLRKARGKVRLIGPNCLGVRNFHLPMNASPSGQKGPPPGNIAFISQSGAFGNAAMAALTEARVGLSKLASVGNMADLSHAHIFRYLVDDPDTEVVTAFVEGVPDVPAFLDAVSAVARVKPIVILKGGRSKSGQRAALSHTGSLAGDGRVWDALLREAGAISAINSQELFDAASAFSRHGKQKLSGNRAAIFSLAGGPGVVAADQCDLYGVELPPLEQKLQKLRAIVPPYAALGNPVEVTGQTKRENLATCAQAIIQEPEIDALIGIAIGLDFKEFADCLIGANKTKPVVACVVAENSENLLAEGGVANFRSVDRAVRALRHLMTRAENAPADRPRQSGAEARPLPAGALTEAASKAFLGGYGLPVTKEVEVRGAEAAVAAADKIGYPVAIKVSAAEIAHKSDVGGVTLDLKDAAAVLTATKAMIAKFPGASLLVQEMIPKGIELIIGARRTRETGPVLMIGFGGVFTEVLDDVVFCRAPASVKAVKTGLGRLRAQALLNGYRGDAPINRDAVADLAARVSAIVAANPSIAEVDLNPVIATGGRLVVVDALIRSEPV